MHISSKFEPGIVHYTLRESASLFRLRVGVVRTSIRMQDLQNEHLAVNKGYQRSGADATEFDAVVSLVSGRGKRDSELRNCAPNGQKSWAGW
jgi:hypothetical protein